MPTEAELRASMGDTNNDGIVSEAEVLAALENDDKGQLIDQFFKFAFGAHLQNVEAALGQELATRHLDNTDKSGEIYEQSRQRMQKETDSVLKNAHAAPPSEYPDGQAMQAITAIEIPHEVARIMAAVKTLPEPEFEEPAPVAPPPQTPQYQWDPFRDDRYELQRT